jgi:hypothetical protein
MGRVHAVLVLLLASTIIGGCMVSRSEPFSIRNVNLLAGNGVCVPPGGFTPPSHSTVQFNWTMGGRAVFQVVSCSSQTTIYEKDATNGSGSFVADGNSYRFGMLCGGTNPSPPCYSANVSGTISTPAFTI